jgi:hypothetical protein
MIQRRLLLRWLCALVVPAAIGLGFCQEADASVVLFASTGNANSAGGGQIYRIDPVAMTVTFVGNTGLSRVGGIDFDSNGVLYAVDGGSVGPSSLYTISSANASILTSIGTISGIQGVDSIAFDAADILYGAGWSGTVGVLLTIDASNASIDSSVDMSGSGNSFVAGLAFDPSGTLYGSRGNAGGHTEDLITIDTGTGVHTPIGGTTDVISDIWIAADGTLYGASPTGDLFTIDKSTGDKTFLFNTGVRIAGLTGLERAVPEPSTFVLASLGLVVAGGLAIRRRF